MITKKYVAFHQAESISQNTSTCNSFQGIDSLSRSYAVIETITSSNLQHKKHRAVNKEGSIRA